MSEGPPELPGDQTIQPEQWTSSLEEGLLSTEQLRLSGLEAVVSTITLSEDGKINLPNEGAVGNNEQAEQWRKKDGIIDAQEFEGATIVIYNANDKIPEGCPDLRGLRSGEYDPITRTCFVDLSDSWSFIDDKYVPAMLQQYVRHELRHHLVNDSDTKYDDATNAQEHRHANWEQLLKEDEEKAVQLAYLDELHSQFFDVIDGQLEGREQLTHINAKFYSIARDGTHSEVGTTREENIELVSQIFRNLQAVVLLYWANIQTEQRDVVTGVAQSIGAVLATERSLAGALGKMTSILEQSNSNLAVQENLQTYLATYLPRAGYNMPHLSPELTELFSQT